MNRLLFLSLAAFVGGGVVFGDTLYSLDPKSSFVLADTNSGEFGYLPDMPDAPLWIPVDPLSTITIVSVGGICYAGTDPQGTQQAPCWGLGTNHQTSAAETAAEIGGVFTATMDILPDDQLQRLPTAISSGLPDYTDPYYTTFYFDRNVSTVNPFDFLIPYGPGVTITVPAGAHWLAVGVFDSYYNDNTDPSGTLGVVISVLSPVPEPSTAGMILIALAGTVALLRLSSRRG